MIIYATKLTVERFKIELPEQMPSPQKEFIEGFIGREEDDRLLQWGAKLFYFDRRKCLEIANFASKFTLFLIDIKVSDLNNIGNYMANYISYIYRHDPEMLQLLDRFFKESPHLTSVKFNNPKGWMAFNNHGIGRGADASRLDGSTSNVDYVKSYTGSWTKSLFN